MQLQRVDRKQLLPMGGFIFRSRLQCLVVQRSSGQLHGSTADVQPLGAVQRCVHRIIARTLQYSYHACHTEMFAAPLSSLYCNAYFPPDSSVPLQAPRPLPPQVPAQLRWRPSGLYCSMRTAPPPLPSSPRPAGSAPVAPAGNSPGALVNSDGAAIDLTTGTVLTYPALAAT